MFRGELKTRAKSIIEHHYRLFPDEMIPGQLEYFTAVADNVKALLKSGKFLHGGLDEQVRLGCTTGLGNPCGLWVRVLAGVGAGQDLTNPARVMYPSARVTGFADYIAKRGTT
jgi:hypothetical protein